jgi:hypothetical protein
MGRYGKGIPDSTGRLDLGRMPRAGQQLEALDFLLNP